MLRIADNTFAAACFDQNTIADLVEAMAGPADATDMATWGLTEAEWREQIEIALAAKRAEAAE